jgi:hypothetical protein
MDNCSAVSFTISQTIGSFTGPVITKSPMLIEARILYLAHCRHVVVITVDASENLKYSGICRKGYQSGNVSGH